MLACNRDVLLGLIVYDLAALQNHVRVTLLGVFTLLVTRSKRDKNDVIMTCQVTVMVHAYIAPLVQHFLHDACAGVSKTYP